MPEADSAIGTPTGPLADGVRSDIGIVADGDLDQLRVAPVGPFKRGTDELPEERRRSIRTALELRVCLGGNPVRMSLKFDELHEAPVG